jgi:RNA polymerase sigma-70 factor (ECF subfamily)
MDRGKLNATYFLYRAGFITKRRFFEIIWNINGKKIYFFIHRLLLPGKEDNEDLFQEVMIKIFSGIDNYDPKYGINTWMFKITRNHCIDYMKRKQHNENCIEEEMVPSPAGNPEQLYLAGELVDEIAQAVGRLSREERELAFLRLYEKMKFTEIGEITGENINTLKTKMRRIMLKLQHELKDYRNE